MRIGPSSALVLMLSVPIVAWGQPSAQIIPPSSAAPTTRGGTVSEPPLPGLYDHGPGIMGNSMPNGALPEDVARPANATPQLFWLRTDYLHWFINKEPLAPVIQSLPDSLAATRDIPPGSGFPLFPNRNEIDYKGISGIRINTGVWFGYGNVLGIDFSGFNLQNKSQSANYASSGSPIITRFYDDPTTNRQTFLLFSNIDPQNSYSGSVSAALGYSNLYNFDTSIRWQGYRLFADNADWLFGVRYFNFEEKLDILARANFPSGLRLGVEDHFSAKNTFYGAQVGLNSRFVSTRRLTFDGLLKFAVGGISQRVDIRGSNTLIRPNGVVDTQAVGLWAQPSNIGSYSKGKFAVLPEFGLTLGYNITERLGLTFGYSAMYVSNVVRVNTVVNTQVNPTTIRYLTDPNTPVTPAPNPTYRFNDTGMWIDGWNFGVRWEF